jgi:hypothetical protein
MQTNIDRQRSHAFVLTPEDVTAMVTLLAKHYGNLSISALCSEGSKLSSNELAEILAYENPNFRRIESLTIRGGEVYGEGCSIDIGTRMFSTCNLTVSDHEDKRALKIADELGKRFDDCKPWYSFLTRVTPTFLIAALSFVWATLGLWQIVIKTGRIPRSPDISVLYVLYLAVPIVIIYSILVMYADRGWKWMFPKVWFSIGRQDREFEKRAKVRSWVFGGIILSILLSIIANLITNAITKP